MPADFGLLDTITTAFTQASAAGAFRLGAFSLAALGVAGTIQWYRHYGALVLSGSPLAGDTLASALLILLSLGGYYFVLKLLPAGASLLYLSMTSIAGMVTGDPTMGQQLAHPSTVAGAGMVAGQPLLAMVDHLSAAGGSGAFTSLPKQFVLLGAYLTIVGAFIFTALHVAFIAVEYSLAITVGAVLIPWGIWDVPRPLAEFSIGWIFGTATRVLVTSVVLALTWPLLGVLLPVTTDPNALVPDMTYLQIFATIGAAIFLAIVAWVVPGRSAALVGRGLALSGSTLMAAAAGSARWGMMVHGLGGVIRGRSTMLGG
jgi:type IV secretory pathway TrbL component